MKFSKQLIGSFILLIAAASLYRIMPGRPFGFAPQIAMAIFGGAIIKDKKFAFILPLLSMLVSDALYEVLYRNGVGNIYGFYEGQFANYVLFAGLTVFGFFIKNLKVKNIAIASLTAPTAYFLVSNFMVWASSSPLAGLQRPKTFEGLVLCYGDGLPFYAWSLVGTFVFAAIFFGSYYFMTRTSRKPLAA